ncbi:DUF1648 domain-containing protein [Nesterenkonia rhizosphaerae]|uniref:DUF1648 domain-containing protein n=1 Tax=Nesterenkonia rhizosphaerae TaxID=1348272 RepID=A0ABP9G0Q5_9MICC
MGETHSAQSEPEFVTSYQESVRTGKPLRGDDGTLIYTHFNNRPRPHFTLDPFHRVLFWGSVIAPTVLIVWFILRLISGSLAEEVPLHYGIDGQPTRYGSPLEALIPLILLAGSLYGIAVLTRYPRIYNFPFELNEHNVQRQYQNAVQMMIWIQVSMALVLLAMLLDFQGMNILLPLMSAAMVIMIGSLVGGIFRMYRLR